MSKILISIICPSIRPEGLKIVQECLERQTMPTGSFELLTEIGLVRNGYDLNAAWNRMVKRARGELLVCYQDYIRILDDGLERFWKAYQEHPNTLFTAPVGKVKDWKDKPMWDWRAYKQRPEQTDYTDCLWRTCEEDWGAIPKKAIYDIGGFDEELDKWWSMDNVSVGMRAEAKGYKFLCVFTNPAVAWDHDVHIKNPFRPNWNPAKGNARMATYPSVDNKLDYL